MMSFTKSSRIHFVFLLDFKFCTRGELTTIAQLARESETLRDSGSSGKMTLYMHVMKLSYFKDHKYTETKLRICTHSVMEIL